MCSGDGKVDSLAFDTTGDGKLDLILSDAHTEKVWPCSSPPFSQNLSYLLLVSLLFQFVLRMGFQFCTGNRARGGATGPGRMIGVPLFLTRALAP
jgi:hypothetical protein